MALPCVAGPVMAQDLAGDAATIIVTAPGAGTDADDSILVDAESIRRAGTPDLLAALTRDVAGVTLQDAQNNPFQPNLVYRGFVASPLQGQAQGLAAYLDGGRFNQPFGETVQFDLIPEAAIRTVRLLDASPVYGLNALGGALLLETKDGRRDPGLDLTGTGGRFGYGEASAAAGLSSGAVSAFFAGQVTSEDGWRDFSPSTLYNYYGDIGVDGDMAGIHVKSVGADADLTGNGVSPVELLDARRSAVFTYPDNTRTTYWRVSLHPYVRLGETTRIEATLYEQFLKRRNLNGDAADIEECEEEELEGFLCLETVGADDDEDDDDDDGDDGDDGEEEEEQALLTDSAGDAIAEIDDIDAYGVINRGRERTRSRGALVQIVDERALGAGTNLFVAGFSYDESSTRFGTSTELAFLDDTRGAQGLGPIIVQADGAIAPVDLIARTHSWGLFLSDRLPITGGLSAEIGLRWNRSRVRLEDQIGTALNGDHSFERLNPGIEFDWALSDALTLRAGYAETSRAPTAAELSCADEDAPCSLTNFFVADPPLNQVVARTWEAGAGGSAALGGGRIDWLLSGYRTTNSDDIQYVASAIRGRAFFRNIGHTRRQGLEARAVYAANGLRLLASYAFTDATFRDPLTLSSPANPTADEDGLILVARGDRLTGIPRHSGTISIDKDFGRFSLGGDLIARSGQFLVGDEANDVAEVPGYVTANARASVTIAGGLKLFGEVRNLFDRNYETFGTFSEVDEVFLAEAPDADDPRAFGPGAPRRWYVGLSARF